MGRTFQLIQFENATWEDTDQADGPGSQVKESAQ